VGVVGRRVTRILAATKLAGASLKVLASAALLLPAHAWAGGMPADILLARTIGWREVGEVPRRLHFVAAPPITKVEVRDRWVSRYEERVTFPSGSYVTLEATRYAYSVAVPLQQAFYQKFALDEHLTEQGLQPGIAEAILRSFGGRATAYYVAQGKSTTCFSFVSQFPALSGGVQDLMLSGQDCRPNGTVSSGELVRDWSAILNGIQIK
jgi:hypothetical protein